MLRRCKSFVLLHTIMGQTIRHGLICRKQATLIWMSSDWSSVCMGDAEDGKEWSAEDTKDVSLDSSKQAKAPERGGLLPSVGLGSLRERYSITRDSYPEMSTTERGDIKVRACSL